MESAFYKLLKDKKHQVLTKWQAAAFGSAGQENPLIAKNPSGRFSNPMAYAIEKNTAEILNWLLDVENNPDLFTPLEEICRVKAVQEDKPSQALHFIFALKQIIEEELADENETNYWAVELITINQRIDEIALLAFDLYSDCRAKIYELRMNEIKRLYGRDAE